MSTYTVQDELLGPVLELTVRKHSQKQIAKALGITQQKVSRIQNTFQKDYLSHLSSKALIPESYNTNLPDKEINRPFYEMLSKVEEALTNEEMLYCAIYVSTGNSLEAVVQSGMDKGLERGHEDVYRTNLLLRSEMLKRKSNIQEEIRRLQMEKQEYREATKDRILEMHMEMIEQLKDEGNPRSRPSIIKLLDQVNKMMGNYTSVERSSEISADDVLDSMLARAAEAKPKELTEEPNEKEEDLSQQEVH